MTLSKREKTMLYMLGCCLLITFGMYLFIFPAISEQSDLSEQLAELETQQLARVQAITSMNELDTHIKLIKKELEHGRARYARPMYSENLDTLYTLMLRLHNATPVSFTIGETAEIPVPHYGEGLSKEDTTLTAADVPSLQDYMAAVDKSETVPAAAIPETAPEAKPADAPTIEAIPLIIEAIMSRSDAIAFLSELSSDPAILIKTMKTSNVDAVIDARGNLITSDEITLEVEFSYLLAPDLPYESTVKAPDVTFS